MTATKAKTAGKESPRIRWPILLSATAHLLVISSLLALGGGGKAGPLRGVVDVILVKAAGEGRAAAKRPVPAPSNRGSLETAVSRRAPDSPSAKSSAPARARRRTPGDPLLPAAGDPESGTALPDAPFGPAGEIPSGEEPGPSGPLPHFNGQGPEAPPGNPSGTMAAVRDPGMEEGGSLAWAGTALLRERIQSRIVYPEEAVRRGQQGEVVLRIRIGSGGFPREIRIARSSGARLLDEAARRGVVRSAPLPSDPGWVEVPVLFRLR
jgi:protein TonB